MQKVISINLNGNACQVEERGYEALMAYLENAQRQLRDNPDRAEIVADLEQAIAEKCQRFLTAHKTVVTGPEVDTILNEMGPVDAEPAGDAGGSGGSTAAAPPGAPRRLYRIADGAMLAGICNGIGAYFRVDPTIVRVIFVGLLLLTKGAFALVYLVLAFVLPDAKTSEERAAAYGEPFNARELIDRAKERYTGYAERNKWRAWRRDRREWRRQWRQNMRGWRWGAAYVPPPTSYASRLFAGLMVPVLTLASVALFWLLLFAIFSLVTEQQVFGELLPDDVPLWLGIVILVVIYQAIAWPLHMLRRSSYYMIGGAYHGTVAAFDGLLSLAFVLLGIWVAFNYMPEVREFMRQLPEIVRSFTQT